jgi:hypothetical protein
LGEEWRIKPQQALLESLRELVDARFEYRDLKH